METDCLAHSLFAQVSYYNGIIQSKGGTLLSENSKWGIYKTYQNETDGVRNKKVLGYRYNGEKYVVHEYEAEIVRLIFERTAEGIAASSILEELKKRGAKTWRGYDFTYGH